MNRIGWDRIGQAWQRRDWKGQVGLDKTRLDRAIQDEIEMVGRAGWDETGQNGRRQDRTGHTRSG